MLEHLKDFLTESVVHKHDKRFPSELDQEEFIHWLDQNGFRSLGVWDDNNASIVQTTKGLRYLIGPGGNPRQEWMAIAGDGKTSVTIRFGEKRPGRHFDSELYDGSGNPRTVRFSEIEGILKTIIDETK